MMISNQIHDSDWNAGLTDLAEAWFAVGDRLDAEARQAYRELALTRRPTARIAPLLYGSLATFAVAACWLFI